MIDGRTLHSLEFTKVLEHLANFCCSPSGREAALALRPCADIAQAREAALLLEECCLWHGAGHEGGEGFRLSSFPDISGVGHALHAPNALLDTEALWMLREVLRLAASARGSITTPLGQSRWPRLLALATATPPPAEATAALNRCINDDALLRDESSPGLALARNELRNLHRHCIRKVKDFATQYNILHYLQDEFMTLASDRYVLPIKANFKGRLQGIIHDWSQTGETCYFEPIFLVQINNRLQELKHEEREEERKVLAYLTGLVRTQWAEIAAAAALLGQLDLLLAKERLGEAMGARYCAELAPPVAPPVISPGPDNAPGDDASGPDAPGLDTAGATPEYSVELRGARHPLLALQRQAQPVDILLRHGQRGLLISGGNAGGKTVCLKTLGLMALMSLSGLPIPAERGARLPGWTGIHAFIGDEQSLDDQVSTFTAQIRHLATVWPTADSNTLILLDEFGAGTDPTQGAALAQAVLDCLLERGVSVAAATHFPALKVYALTHPRIRAASVLFDPGTKRPLFRLAYDQVGTSQALDVAREHGLPEDIVRRAEHYLLLEGGSDGPGRVIDQLNALSARREKELEHLRREQERYAAKRAQLQERFAEERQKLLDEVRGKSQELMAAWKAGKATPKQSLKEMSRIRAELARRDAATSATEFDAPPATPQAAGTGTSGMAGLAPGQAVLHRSLGARGVITELDPRRQRVRMEINGVSLWAWATDVTASAAGANGTAHTAGEKPRTRVSVNLSPLPALLRLDLRGKRADMALSEVERFLDKALLDGRREVEIIHGRGTGVLRRQVQEFLRSCPSVAHAALAPEDRGGDGMTIVTLR